MSNYKQKNTHQPARAGNMPGAQAFGNMPGAQAFGNTVDRIVSTSLGEPLGNPFPCVGNEHTFGGNQTFYVCGGNQTSQCFDATESASQGGLVAAALAHPSAIRKEQSRVESVDVTQLKQFMDTFATWCPCSDVHKISVLLHGIIYQDKPLTVVEAGKCLELVESSIKAMRQKPFGCGPEKFKQLVPNFKKLYKMRNDSSHATMVPAPDYNEVICLLATVLNSYHKKYFVREFGRCWADRQCHDPKCPKREECLKQQQEYLRPSASCVAASVQEQDIEQIIRDEENSRLRLAKRAENAMKQREEYLEKNPPNVDWDLESLEYDYSNLPNPIFTRQDLKDFDLYNRGCIWETLLKESLKRKDFRQLTPGDQRQIMDMYIFEIANVIDNCTDYNELYLLKRAIKDIWRASKDKMKRPELMQGALEAVEFAWWKKDRALDSTPRNGKKKYSFGMLMVGEVDAEYYFWLLPSDVRKTKLENGGITMRFSV